MIWPSWTQKTALHAPAMDGFSSWPMRRTAPAFPGAAMGLSQGSDGGFLGRSSWLPAPAGHSDGATIGRARRRPMSWMGLKNSDPGRAPNPSTPGEGSGAHGDSVHRPVLLEEILRFFAPGPGQWILDGTLGFGGHSERFLQAGSSVVGIDQDPDALERANERLKAFQSRFYAIGGNSAELPGLLAGRDELPQLFDAMLFDLGVSSWQLDQPGRGFSFQADGPLDMRMDPAGEPTAADLVNELGEEELAKLLWAFGEERASRTLARAIVNRRRERPFRTTGDLAGLVSRLVRRTGKLHPATRTFQALRIAVNRELEVLPEMLSHAAALLKPGGKLAVISFHGLEDRIVKHYLRDRSREMVDDPTWPEARPNEERYFHLPGKLIQPAPEECAANPRARSARLRCAIRLPN